MSITSESRMIAKILETCVFICYCHRMRKKLIGNPTIRTSDAGSGLRPFGSEFVDDLKHGMRVMVSGSNVNLLT